MSAYSPTDEQANCCANAECVEDGDVREDCDSEEADHFEKVVNVFRYYRTHSFLKIKRDYNSYCKLEERHKKLLQPSFPLHLKNTKDRVVENDRFLRKVLGGIGQIFENKDHQADVQASQLRPATEFDMEKLQSTLKQISRDWSAEGKAERNRCYNPVIEEILRRFPNVEQRKNIRVLVPGAGMGRLALDIAKLGFECQGNEFSLFMLFVSNFILNKCKEVNAHQVYPWVHQNSNNMTYADQLRPVCFPDVNPSDLPADRGGFSMAAGDFLDVYGEDYKDHWDCVATVFFMDTAANIMDYIERIHKILKPGGVWINLGPLLYHFADMPSHDSIELPYEEVKRVVGELGFRMDSEKLSFEATYTNNLKSMLHYQYDCVFFVCVKE